MFKKKLLQQEQGFTLIEVLVSILITTMFVAVAMQLMVIAVLFKTRAKQHSEVTNWIQEDLENVKYQAAKLKSATLTAAAASGNTVLNVSWVDGFVVGDTLIVGTDATNNVILSINASASPPTLTLSSALGTDQGQGVAVVANNQCNVLSSTLTTGFANSLSQNLPPVIDNGQREITGKNYTLARITNIKNVSPFEVLELTYSITPTIGSTVTTMYMEVIPNVAVRCP